MPPLIRRAMFYLAILAAWQAAYAFAVWPPYLFPSPMDVARSLGATLADGALVLAVAISLKRIAIGFVIAALAGGILGMLCARVQALDETVGAAMLGLQALPSICWFPLALLWLGLNERAILFITVVGALFAIATATNGGVKGIPPIYLKAARTMGARGWRLYAKVILPAALPAILGGMRQGWSFAWRSLMAAELLSVNLGLGHLLMVGRELNDVAQVMAVVLVILVLGLCVDGLVFTRLENGVRRRWGLALGTSHRGLL